MAPQRRGALLPVRRATSRGQQCVTTLLRGRAREFRLAAVRQAGVPGQHVAPSGVPGTEPASA